MNKNWLLIVGAIIIIVGAIVLFAAKAPHSAPSNGAVQVIAAENFWGSLVSQIGGSHVVVTSIVTDPNADPHEYESNAVTARAVAGADYLIVNGAGYDSWMDKLLGADTNQNRKVFKVADLLGKKEGDNPHFWYNPAYVNQIVAHIASDLSAIDPAHASDYQANYQTLQAGLAGYQNQISGIKQKYAGVPVGATEDIFFYLGDASGLVLASPPEFAKAVGEGNDPPAASVVAFQDAITAHRIKILVYNVQTVTPITEQVKSLASANHIPIIGISETLQPPAATFQDWMSAEMTALGSALAQATGK